MIHIDINLNVEETGFRAIRELADPDDLIHLSDDAEIAMGGLEGGMESGEPSAAFCFTLPDGRVVLAETSMRLLLSAADALRARYGDPRRSG